MKSHGTRITGEITRVNSSLLRKDTSLPFPYHKHHTMNFDLIWLSFATDDPCFSVQFDFYEMRGFLVSNSVPLSVISHSYIYVNYSDISGCMKRLEAIFMWHSMHMTTLLKLLFPLLHKEDSGFVWLVFKSPFCFLPLMAWDFTNYLQYHEL